MKGRFFLLTGFTTLIFIFAAWHLYTLQIKESDLYVERVRASQSGTALLSAPRGNIYLTDRSGSKIPAALTKEYSLIYAVPAEIEDSAEAVTAISAAFNLDKTELTEALSKTRSQFTKLISKASEVEVLAAQNLGLKGLYIKPEKFRFYPLGKLAAHVLGLVGLTQEDDAFRGRYGIELYQEPRLAGRSGRYTDSGLIDPIPGEDLLLTIDRNIQMRAEEIIANLVDQYAPEKATIIVQEPKTGKVVALANYPNFDPNAYATAEVSDFLNPAVSNVYEPGSIFKVITMAAGLDADKITPSTTYYDTGSVTLNGREIKNWDLKANGTLTMAQVIEGSVNTGAVFAEQQIGHQTFYDYLVKFGFKETTEIDLPAEVTGSLAPLERDPQPVNFATAAFGQGVSVTPLRLAAAISTIANGGVMKKPYLTEFNRSLEERRVISKEAARQVTEMMVSAVDKAKVASLPKYHVAGKTGTAQIPTRGGYLPFEEGVIHSYAGFAPAYDPEFTILIKLDKPQGTLLAGQTVVPAFRELTEFLLNYYQVAPTRVQ